MFLFFSTDHPWLSALSVALCASPFLGGTVAEVINTLRRKWRSVLPLYRASCCIALVTVVLLCVQSRVRLMRWGRRYFASIRQSFSRDWRHAFGGNRATGQPAPHSTRLDEVLSTIRKLPVCEFHTRPDLLQKSVGELKQLLKERGVGADARNKCLQKSELIDMLFPAGGGSSHEQCSICLDEYDTGDVLRVLPCVHRYHLECLDKWALTSTDYSKEPSCPLCNAPISGSKAALPSS
jgi:E3 ubiquitin-protein ligase RNF38/44